MTFRRRTLAGEARFGGDGLHTGASVEVVIRPGSEGIMFRFGSGSWAATPENVTDTTRSTRLGEIGTIEHLMSALAGLEVTDADVEVSAPELPALDGAAHAYVLGLEQTGYQELGEEEAVTPFTRVFVQEPDSKIAVSAGTGHWRYEFSTVDRWPRLQVYETADVVADYVAGISRARTFGFDFEVEPMRSAGMGRGLNESNVLILGPSGYVNEPLFQDEPPRHKLLDAIGDLYLAGLPIRYLNVVAERTGHKSNVKAATLLWEAARA